MENEELDHIFGYINGVENEIQQIEDMKLYEYVVNCIIHNEYATIEDYKELLKE